MSRSFSNAYSNAFDREIIPVGNWYTLAGFLKEAEQVDESDRAGVPTSCAVDYTALREGPGGKLQCPWCGLAWPEDASAWGEFPGAF